MSLPAGAKLGVYCIASPLVLALALTLGTGLAMSQSRPAALGAQSEKETGDQLLSYLQSKQLEQAISLGQQAVERWPQNADFHHWLGIAYFQSGRNAEALEQLGRAAKLRPGDYDIQFDAALVHLQEQQYAAAAEQLQQALRLKPDLIGQVEDGRRSMADKAEGLLPRDFCVVLVSGSL